jgi:hypothetical protein
VEEGDDFLLNEISLTAQHFRHPEFTLLGEPLSPLNIANETQKLNNLSLEHPPTSGVRTHEEGTTEALGVVSPEIRLGNSASGSEEGPYDEEPGQRTTLDPGTHIPGDRPLGGTSIPSTSGAGPSSAPCTFDFIGVRLLSDPLEALTSVLPNGLFEDIGKTTPFKFAQDIIESQIAVFFLCILLIIFLFSSSYFSFIFFASGLSSICRCLVQLSGAYARQPRRRDHSPSQDEVIAGLTQELSNLKERYKGLETRDRVPETFPGRVPNPSSETRGDEVLPDAEQMWLTAKSDRARQEVERLSGELSSLRDEKLNPVADLN